MSLSPASSGHSQNIITTLNCIKWFALFCLIILPPLKIWRTHLLVQDRVSYMKGDSEQDYSLLIRQLKDDQMKDGQINGSINPNLILDQIFLTDKTEAKVKEAWAFQKRRIDAEKYPKLFVGFSWPQKVGDGLADRFDDLSYWNCFGLYIVAMIMASVTKLISITVKSHDETDTIHSLTPLKLTNNDWVIFLCVATLFIGGMLFAHKYWDNGPIHGAFWCQNAVPHVQTTQAIDATLFSIAGACGAFLITIAFKLLGFWSRLGPPNWTDRDLASLNRLLYALYTVPLFVIVPYIWSIKSSLNKLSQLQVDFGFTIALYWGILVILVAGFLKLLNSVNDKLVVKGQKPLYKIGFSNIQKLFMTIKIERFI
jgi:hypothetical protein